MLKYKIVYAAVFIISAILFLTMNTAQSLIFLIMMAALPFLVKISAHRLSRRIEISCEMSSACVAGVNTNPIVMRIKNSNRVSVGSIEAEIEYENHMFSELSKETIMIPIVRGTSVFEIPSKSEKCGRCSVRINNMYCSDPLKLTRNALGFKWNQSFTVYPKVPQVYIETDKMLASDFDGTTYDKYRSGRDKSEVFQVREYAEGDELSAVHWKLSSKTDNLIVREWGRPNNFKILVLCESSLTDTDGNKISPEVTSAVFGLAEAVSHNLSENGIGHQFGMMTNGIPVDRAIVSIADSESALDELMSIVVQEKCSGTKSEFLSLGYQDMYSKLIYIIPAKNASAAAELAAYMNTTVIAVSEGDKKTAVSGGLWSMYNISEENLMKDTHYIVV